MVLGSVVTDQEQKTCRYARDIDTILQKQIYCVEPMMVGTYIKHNDNDGNIDSAEQVFPSKCLARCPVATFGAEDFQPGEITYLPLQLPQTFSHWTWEESRHTLCVVDIQGVGDCYTDPQVRLFSRCELP
jgi:hypothetical protein